MDKALLNFLTVSHFIWWPISKLITLFRILLTPLLHAVIFFLSPIWILGGFLLLPFIHLARALVYIVTIPLQLKWLDRLETLYIYLGTAGLIGCMAGAILYLTFHFLSTSLSIDKDQPRKPRTAAEFRSTRRKKQDWMMAPVPPRVALDKPTRVALDKPTRVALDKTFAPSRRGLLSQAIVEEEDSDF